jgi:hypothetical protein
LKGLESGGKLCKCIWMGTHIVSGLESKLPERTTPTVEQYRKGLVYYSNITSFFRFVDKRAIYRLGIISLAHTPVHVTDFSVVNVHVDELSPARIWQHKLCATFSATVNNMRQATCLKDEVLKFQ